jgi:hypothetical protein
MTTKAATPIIRRGPDAIQRMTSRGAPMAIARRVIERHGGQKRRMARCLRVFLFFFSMAYQYHRSVTPP